MSLVSRVWTASSKSVPAATAVSSSVAQWSSASAMIVLSMTIGTATVCPDPGARNSNRLPVNANGLVRLRSPGSVGRTGSVSTPITICPLPFDDVAGPLASCSNTSAS